jgi:hypothetical protein
MIVILSFPQRLKPLPLLSGLIAALEALRHPNSGFLANSTALLFQL